MRGNVVLLSGLLVISFLVAAFLQPRPALSAECQNEARLREALRSANSQVRTLEDERARWQATEAEQKKELESLKAELAAQTRRARSQKASAELNQRLSEQTEANQTLTANLNRCQTAYRDAEETARANDDQRAKLSSQVGAITKRAETCEGKNARIYHLAHEMLDQCQKMGVGDALMAPLEPLTGLRRVRLENLYQEFDDKLIEEKAQP